MSDCKHNHLWRIEGPTLPSKSGAIAYHCQECKEMLLVNIRPFTIGVSYGRPEGEPKK